MASPLRGTRTQTPADDARLTRSENDAPRARTRPGFGLTDVSLLLMALIWGVNYTSVKYATSVIEPLAFNGVRVTLAAISLVLIAQIDLPMDVAGGYVMAIGLDTSHTADVPVQVRTPMKVAPQTMVS